MTAGRYANENTTGHQIGVKQALWALNASRYEVRDQGPKPRALLPRERKIKRPLAKVQPFYLGTDLEQALTREFVDGACARAPRLRCAWNGGRS